MFSEVSEIAEIEFTEPGGIGHPRIRLTQQSLRVFNEQIRDGPVEVEMLDMNGNWLGRGVLIIHP
jgi:hypothetical protein